MISEAIKQTGGKDAANYLLGERFIDAYGKIQHETLIFDTNATKPNLKIQEAFSLLDNVKTQ